MELQAVLEILKFIKSHPRHPDLTIKTDSKYVINGLSNWMKAWKKNGWRTSSGKPVVNQDLWKSLDEARLENVGFEFVKGHSGDNDNERVDQIAVSYSKGTHLNLKSSDKSHLIKESLEPISDQLHEFDKPAPQKLQRLLSRLDMASHIAKHGYSLTIEELAELLEMSTNEISKKKNAWQWRNWLIETTHDSKWKFKLIKQPMKSHKKCNDK